MSVLGIDETSSKKGHNYMTVAVDMEEGRVVFATPWKGGDCIKKTAEHLKEKGTEAQQVTRLSIGMSAAFISGVGEHLPQAQTGSMWSR